MTHDINNLAQFIRRTDGDHTMGAGALSEAIIAAGYRKPRTITTPEEADTLPDGCVVRDAIGWVAIVGDGFESASEYCTYPATVLWVPAQ